VFEILCKRYNKSIGEKDHTKTSRDPIKDGSERICYLTFLKELDECMTGHASPFSAEPTPHNATSHATSSNVVSDSWKGFATEILEADSQEKLMMRIKTKAKTERIRVIDFMADFDHLKHGKITKNEFRRALKVLFSILPR
jgi:hypothetical protein